jgi:hypothetical protein
MAAPVPLHAQQRDETEFVAWTSEIRLRAWSVSANSPASWRRRNLQVVALLVFPLAGRLIAKRYLRLG